MRLIGGWVVAAALSASCAQTSPSGPTFLVGIAPGKAGSSDVSGESAGTCRTYATEYSYVTRSAFDEANTTVSCNFDVGALTLTCHYRQSTSLQACTVDFDSRSVYDSLSDFVNEFPGRPLVARHVTTGAPLSMSCTRSTAPAATTYTYDGRQRLVRRTGASGPGSPVVTVNFGAWDDRNRYTFGTLILPESAAATVSYTYDDAAHTIAQIASLPGALSTVTTQAFDADGILLRERSEAAGTVTETTHTVFGRQQICG
jgi:hypothetical protein